MTTKTGKGVLEVYNMNTNIKNSRYFGAILISPLIIVLLIGGVYLKIITFLLSIMGMYEVYKVINSGNKFNSIPIIGFALLALYYLTGISIETLGYMLIISTLLLLCIPVINLKYNFADMFLTLGVFIYVGVFLSLIPNIYDMQGGNYLIWLIFLSSWIGDTAAYYSGRFLGKHKLCPDVSPKKTVEGSIGGLIGSILSCGLFGIVTQGYLFHISLIHFFLMGALAGILGQFGDLTASSIKRYFKVKDYSHLIPGHGGILDRFDSIIFSSVAIFMYLSLILGL